MSVPSDFNGAIMLPGGQLASDSAIRNLIESYGGLTSTAGITETAGENLSGHQAVILDASDAFRADASDVTHLGRVIGLTVTSASIGASVTIATSGRVPEPSWSWTPDFPIYVAMSGALTQTPPTYLSGVRWLQVIGFAVDATTMFVDINPPITLSP